LFNVAALDFDYDAAASSPVRWIAFLNELFGADFESIESLQEWFGYALVADTSQQKILLMVGPRRSGKGTIARVLTRLVGAANVAGPTVSSLGGNFGLQPLLGKSLAIVSDARFAGENIGTIVERLLCISGEDAVTIDRKFATSVTMKLPTRFVFLTNELPRFNDASTALAGRFLVLRLTRSFYGSENISLTDQLLEELPGILLWALDGWRRLRDQGRFTEPESSRTAIQDLEDLASPVSAFVRDRCVLGPEHRVPVPEIYVAWQAWCAQDGRTSATTRQTFGRDLQAAVPSIQRRQGTDGTRFYAGIRLA
jgi:putative DNA primase/helicase